MKQNLSHPHAVLFEFSALAERKRLQLTKHLQSLSLRPSQVLITDFSSTNYEYPSLSAKNSSLSSKIISKRATNSEHNGIKTLFDIGKNRKISKEMIEPLIHILAQQKFSLNDTPILSLRDSDPEDTFYCFLDKMNHCLAYGKFKDDSYINLFSAIGISPDDTIFGIHYDKTLREFSRISPEALNEISLRTSMKQSGKNKQDINVKTFT